jgi:hypothetical protein
MRKSTAAWNIANLVAGDVITLDDLDGFSQDLIDGVKLMLKRYS